jgi:hypothetical protein
MQEMMNSIQVTSTDETKEIAGYTCTKYTLAMMGMTHDYWLSKEVEEYEELKAISTKMMMIFEKNPMLKQANIMGMMDQLDGFPIQMIINVMGGGTITTTLKKIEKMSLDKNLFNVPEGYTLIQMPQG